LLNAGIAISVSRCGYHAEDGWVAGDAIASALQRSKVYGTIKRHFCLLSQKS